jgi:hypothetical protein
MTQNEMDCECKPDRIVTIVSRAMDDLIFREDPDFYDGTGPGGEIRAALMIGCIRRRSQNGVAIEAMAIGFDRSELPTVWEELQRVASNALAKHRSEGLTTSVNGPIN